MSLPAYNQKQGGDMRADEKLPAFPELESATRDDQRLLQRLDGMKGASELFKLTRLCKIQSFITKGRLHSSGCN
jgi:hypothetical protein